MKDESRWIVAVLSSMLPACDRIFVMDDHSTDETVALARKVPNVTVFESPFEGLQETRDKNWLLDQISESVKPGDWIVHVDGDEEIAAPGCQVIRELAERSNGADAFRFRVLYLWDRPNQVRIDAVYSNFRRPSMFRYRPGARFESGTAGGFHCGNVPDPLVVADSDVKLLHYGYMHQEDRIRKYRFYNTADPDNRSEDGYRHFVIGDLFPADSQFAHAGPLRLKPLEQLA